MVSLYDILEVPPTATKEEIKKAYKTMAMKTHPDRFTRNGVSVEERKRAESEFQKVNAAYEVLSNDVLRQQYDLTGQVPNNPALGSTSSNSSSSRSWGPNDQFNARRGPRFGFGSDSLFNDHEPFRSSFFSSGFGSFDTFQNDPFFTPHTRQRPHSMNGFGAFSGDPFFRGFEDMMQDFVQPSFSRTAGPNRFGPPPFPSFFGGFPPQAGRVEGFGQPRPGQGQGQSSHFSSFTTATYSNGRWMTESSEESNINGVRKTQRQRTWVDDEGVEYVERTRPDGNIQRLRDGIEQQRPNALPAPPEPVTDQSSRRSNRSGRH
ncbi:hypothetical protein FRC16_010510 [Serendipita sp. 398]|nr:hypothetical protein FRC16_010510 [Serendipita sp. 398]